MVTAHCSSINVAMQSPLGSARGTMRPTHGQDPCAESRPLNKRACGRYAGRVPHISLAEPVILYEQLNLY